MNISSAPFLSLLCTSNINLHLAFGDADITAFIGLSIFFLFVSGLSQRISSLDLFNVFGLLLWLVNFFACLACSFHLHFFCFALLALGPSSFFACAFWLSNNGLVSIGAPFFGLKILSLLSSSSWCFFYFSPSASLSNCFSFPASS